MPPASRLWRKKSRRAMRGCFGCDACAAPSTIVIPGCALLGAGPESILTMVVMDSGLAASRRPGMTERFVHDCHRGNRNDKIPHRLDQAGAVAVFGRSDRADRAADVVACGIRLHHQGAATDAAEFRHAVQRSRFP